VGTTTSQSFQITNLRFSPNGKEIIAGGAQDVEVWDVSDPSAPAPAESLPVTVNEVGWPFSDALFLADDYVLVARDAAPPEIYDLAINDHRKQLCAEIGNPLNQTEWQTYAPKISFTRACP
jgi:WD40 repeat protein